MLRRSCLFLVVALGWLCIACDPDGTGAIGIRAEPGDGLAVKIRGCDDETRLLSFRIRDTEADMTVWEIESLSGLVDPIFKVGETPNEFTEVIHLNRALSKDRAYLFSASFSNEGRAVAELVPDEADSTRWLVGGIYKVDGKRLTDAEFDAADVCDP